MAYDVRFPSASLEKKFEKDISRVPREARLKIIEEVQGLALNPRPFSFKKIKPPVELFQFVAQYRVRIGSYRVLYDIDDRLKIVWIFAVKKRDEKTYK